MTTLQALNKCAPVFFKDKVYPDAFLVNKTQLINMIDEAQSNFTVKRDPQQIINAGAKYQNIPVRILNTLPDDTILIKVKNKTYTFKNNFMALVVTDGSGWTASGEKITSEKLKQDIIDSPDVKLVKDCGDKSIKSDSSLSKDDQIKFLLKSQPFVSRVTYKTLAEQFSVKPAYISAIRYKLIKTGEIQK
jgi:hypothetical protein